MSSRKSKKRIGSTRQRNLGHKAEERDANEELTETITETPDEASNAGKTGVLQELSTVHHMQPLYSGEMPKCQLDVVSENIEGDQHDPGKTSTEKLETGAPAELCEAETSTSGKIRRMGSTRRTKQAFKAEERKEEEEKDNNSMQIIQEEFNITRTEDQYLKEEPHAPESDQAHTHLLELGVSEVKGLTERPRDESPGEEHRLLSELDVKTEAQYTHSPPQSFDQCPTPAVNPPFCVTSPQEEGESLLKQSCFNLSEAKEISSTDTTQDTPEGLDGHYQQREDQSPEDVRESDEQRRTEEVVLEVSLNIGDIPVKEHIKHHVLHRKESQEGMPIMKVDNKPLREMEVESAGIQNFSLQIQAMPQGSTAENISEIKDNLQIFQPGNTNTDGTVTEGYDKYGNQNSLQTEQTISIKVSQEKDTNSELNVQRPKKRMGSTRRIVKGNKMIEDIGNSQEEMHEMREDTLLNPELTEEDTKFRLKTVVNDKLDMVFTVNERGAQLEEAGCEFEEQENKHGNLILDENTEGTLIAMDAEVFHSTENITGDSGTMTSTSSSQLVMEGNLDHHHNEIGRKGVTEIAELNAPRLRERLGSTHEPLQGEKEVKREYGCDLTGKEIDSKDIDFQMIPGTDILAIVKSGKLQVEDIGTESFTDKPTVGSVCESFSPFENDFLASPPMVDHREEMVDNSLNLQGESFDCTKTCMSDKDAVEKAEYITNQSEVRIPSDTFSSFEVAEHFKGAFVREDVDQLQKHDEGKAENSPESPEDQERKNSTNMAVSEQPEIENQLSSPSEDPCENCAGTSAEVIGAIENTNILLPQSEVEILSESFDPLEQNRWSSSTPDHIPEITVASLDVHTESSSLETYSPDIQHCEEVEKGTQAHILSSTMEPEVSNFSTDISDALHNEQTKQSVSQSLTMESTDTSEKTAQYDDCESTFKLPYHTEEANVKPGASKQKRKMGSTRRTKREQKREETSEVMSTDGDYANEDINVKMNTDADIKVNAEEGILEAGIIDALKENEPSTTQTDVGILKMALSCVEQDRYVDCSPSAEVMSSSVPQCNPLEDGQKQDNQHQCLDITAQQLDGNDAANLEADNEISILGKETSEGLTTSEAEPFNEAFMSKDVDQLKKHEEEKAEKSLESLGDQNKEDSISLSVSEQAVAVNRLSSPTEVHSPDCAGITVEDVRASEKTESSFCQSGVGTHGEALDPLEHEHPPSSTPDHIPEIAVASLNVHTESSSPETYNPAIEHCDEVEQGTQAHILSSTMDPEVSNISTDISDALHNEQTKQSVSQSLTMESTDTSEKTAQYDDCESTFKLPYHTEEANVKQGASKQKRKMGSTRRTKREQKREETSEVMSTDGDYANEDINVKMNTDADINVDAEEGILEADIIDALKENEPSTTQTDVGLLKMALSCVEQDRYVDCSPSAEVMSSSVPQCNPLEDGQKQDNQHQCLDITAQQLDGNDAANLEADNEISILGKETSEGLTTSEAEPFNEALMSKDVDQLKKHEEEKAEKSLESLGDQNKEDSISLRVSEQAEAVNRLSSPTEVHSPDCAAITVEDVRASEKTESSFCQSGVGTHGEALDPLEQEHPPSSPTPDHIPEITVASLNVRTESSSLETYSPDIQHCDEVEQGTQTHILSSSMEPEVSNISTDISDALHNEQTKQSVSQSLTMESTDTSEKTAQYDDCESTFKLPYHTEEANVKPGASKQKRKMGSTRRTKREQKREETSEVMSTDGDYANEDINVKMNTDADINVDAEEGILEADIIDALKENEPSTTQTDVGILKMALSCVEQDRYVDCSPSAEVMSSSVPQCNPLEDGQKQDNQHQCLDITAQQLDGNDAANLEADNEISILGKETSEGLTTSEAEPFNEALMSKDVDQLKKHEEEKAEKSLESLGDQNKEDSISLSVSEQAEAVNRLSSPTEVHSPDCAGITVEDVRASEKTESFFCQSGVGTHGEALDPLEQEHPPSSPTPDHIPEIAVASLNVRTESSSPETYNPEIQHCDEVEKGTQAHILSSSMEPEVSNISTDISDALHNEQTVQSVSQSLTMESTDTSEKTAQYDDCESTFKLPYHTEEANVKQGASKQKRKMGSTRRTKREQKREETSEVMSRDGDYANEDINIKMNTDADINIDAEEGILEAGIIDASEKTESFFCQSGVGTHGEALDPLEQEHPPSSPTPDHIPEITVASLDVHTESSSLETYNPEIEHCDEVEQGTQAHILSSTMEPEVSNISTDISDALHNEQTKQSVSQSLTMESTDTSEKTAQYDDCESTFKLPYHTEEANVKQGASKQKRKMGSTRRTKREQKREETSEVMSTDGDYANEDINVKMNTDADIKVDAEEGILEAGIIDALKENEPSTTQTDVGLLKMALSCVEQDRYVDCSPSAEVMSSSVPQCNPLEDGQKQDNQHQCLDITAQQLDGNDAANLEADNEISILGKETSEGLTTSEAEPFNEAFMSKDVDQLKKHEEEKAEKSLESLGDQNKEDSISLSVSEQAEAVNRLSSPTEVHSPDCAGITVEDVRASEKTESFFCQSGVGTHGEALDPLEQEHPPSSPTPDHIPEIAVASLNVRTESSSPETYNPAIEHCDEVKQGTQTHILSSTMDPEVSNISTDISDALHNEQTKQSVSQSLTMESTDTPEKTAQYDDCESTFKLPYHTEEANVKQGASKQKRKMGSTRRTKREQKREETSEVMSTDGDYANEDINVKMNTDADIKVDAEEGILEAGLIDALKENEPSTTQTDVGILKMALSCVEQDRYVDCSPSAEVMSSSVPQCNPLEDGQKQDNQHQCLDITAQQLDGNDAANLEADNEISILGKETSEGLTTSEAEPFNEALMSKDVDQLKKHEEEKAEKSLESLGDQNKEDSISLRVSEQAEAVNRLSSPTEVHSPDCAAITVEDVRASEKTESSFCQSGVGTHGEALDPLEQEHPPSSPTPDHIPEITVASLNVRTESSSLETYSPDIQHCDEVEQGTQTHILSSSMEPEVSNISTDISDALHNEQTKQSVSQSLTMESTDTPEKTAQYDDCESTFKLPYHTEEANVKQGASKQKRKMGSTRRTKREQKREETSEVMSTDGDYANEDINVKMNTDADIKVDAEEGILEAGIIDALKENEPSTTQTDVGILKMALSCVEQDRYVDCSPSAEVMSSSVPQCNPLEDGQKQDNQHQCLDITAQQLDGNDATNLEADNEISILGKETSEGLTTSEAEPFNEAFMSKDVDQLIKHEEEKAEKSLESLGDQNKEDSISLSVSEQAEAVNRLSSPTEVHSPDCAGITVEDVRASEKTESFFCQSGVGTHGEALDPLEQEHPPSSPTPDHIPEIAVASLNVRTESSSPETYNPEIQHCDEVEKGTQAHILSSSMEPEVSNISTDISDALHNEQTVQSVSQSLTMESTDTSEKTAQYDDCESTFKLPYHTEEANVKQGASKQKRKMGSTRRTKREQKREETSEVMSRDGDYANEDINIKMNTDADINIDAEEGILEAGIIDASEKTESFFCQSGVGTHGEALDPLEQEHPPSSPTPDHIPEITVASLDVHTESSSLETYNPEIEHCDEVEQGTQAHILSSTMEPEVSNISTDISDALHNEQTKQSVSQSLTMESTDTSEKTAQYDDCESTFKLPYHTEEANVKQGASKQKRKMGSTRRTKREQKREETSEVMSTDGDYANEDINVKMNTDADIKVDAEEGILEAGIIDALKENEPSTTQTDVGIIKMALSCVEQDRYVDCSPSAEVMSSSVPQCNPLEDGQKQDNQHQCLDITAQQLDGNDATNLEADNEISILGKETSEGLTTSEAEPFNEAFMSKDVDQLKKHEEEKAEKSLESLGDQNKEDSISLSVSEQAVAVNRLSSPTEVHSPDCAAITVEDVRASEKTESSFCQSGVGTHGEALDPLEQEHYTSSPTPDHIPEIAVASLDVHTESSSPETYNPEIEHCDEVEQGTHAHILSSTMESEVSNVSTDISDALHNEQTKQSVSQSLTMESTDTPEKTAQYDDCESTFKLPYHTEEANVKQGASKQKRKMGSTRRTKREQKREETSEVMSTDGDYANEDINVKMNTDADINVDAEEGILEADIIDASEKTESFFCQSGVGTHGEALDPLEQEHPPSSPTPDHIPEITVAPLNVHTESSSPETYNPEIEHCDEVEQGTHAHILSSTMDPEVPNNGAEASELVQDGWTQQSDHCESSLRLQHHEKEESLKQSASRQKRKMGSTRRQKRETNEVNLDEETKSSHETGEMTETEIEVQQEENIQSEQISSREKIHSAGVNTIPMSIGQIEISESSGSTAAEETSYSQLSHEDSQKEPKSMLQKRKMGSSRRGQGLGNRGKGEAEQVDEHMDDTSRQESGGALLQNEGSSKESCSGLLKNTQDLPVEGEQLLASVQSSESHLQPLAQAERPDELIDERVPPASAQSKPSVLQNKDPQTSTKKRKMGSTRKNMRRQGEEDKSDLKAVHGSAQRWNDDTVWDSTISDVEDLPTGPTETATIQKMTETQGQEDTLPHDESAGHGSAGQKKSPQRTRRKMGSRHGGQGYRGIGGLEESEDQPVCKRQEKDGSILQGTQENVHSEGVDEQGLSKLTFTGDEESQKVKQPNPSGARSKLDLERKYGPGDTLTSLEEAVMFNIVMVGESSVGKTSFIHQFQNGQFFDDHSATIGVDTCIQTLAVDGKLVKLQIWDTAGQERFHSLTRQVLHKADGLIVMYDISSSQTFCAVRKWISCIEEGARSEVLIMLLGNKNDSEERQVLHPEGERLAQEHNFHFMECSAATGHNVPQAMEALARLLKQTVKESDEEHVTLHKKPQQKKSGCC